MSDFDEKVRAQSEINSSAMSRKYNEIEMANMPTIICEESFISGANFARSLMQAEIATDKNLAIEMDAKYWAEFNRHEETKAEVDRLKDLEHADSQKWFSKWSAEEELHNCEKFKRQVLESERDKLKAEVDELKKWNEQQRTYFDENITLLARIEKLRGALEKISTSSVNDESRSRSRARKALAEDADFEKGEL